MNEPIFKHLVLYSDSAIQMKIYLLEAAFGLQCWSQLLLLLHPHLNNLMKKLLLRLFGVESAVQCLSQALQLRLQPQLRRSHRGCDGYSCRSCTLGRCNSADGPLGAWRAQVLGRAGRGERWWRQGGQGRSDCWENPDRRERTFCELSLVSKNIDISCCWSFLLTFITTLHFYLHLRVFVILRRWLAGSGGWRAGSLWRRGRELPRGSSLARPGVGVGTLTWGFTSTWVGGAGYWWGHGTHLPQGQWCEGDIWGHGVLQTLVVVEAKRKTDGLITVTNNKLNQGYIYLLRH